MASAAAAADIDVTASLEVTDGWARIGYYVPVTLRATNGTDRAVAEVHVSAGGPVDTRSAWRLAAGESGETVVPVFYVGGEVALEVTFLDRAGEVLARVRPEPVEVRPVPDDTALVWLNADRWEPDDEELEAACRGLEAGRLRIFRKNSSERFFAFQCQLVDAFPFPVPDSGGQYDLVLGPSLPFRFRTALMPEAHEMLHAAGSSAGDPLRAWLWLVLLTGVVAVISVTVPRRRMIWAAPLLAVAGVAAAAGLWFAGAGPSARLREARFAQWTDRSLAERFVLLQTRGGATARYRLPAGPNRFWPRPVFRSAEEMYRPAGVLIIEDDGLSAMLAPGSGARSVRQSAAIAAFETTRAACLLHTLVEPASHLRPASGKPTPEALAELANRADVVAALLVEGGDATDANGRTQPIDAWAVAWKTGGDADLAWAGRSLAWWDRHRRTGDGPFLVAWIRDPAPEPPAGIDVYERLPAMVVYGP